MSIPVNVILSDNATMPLYGSARASGADLYASEDVLILPGETKLVPTGVRLEMPSTGEEGWVLEAQIRDRSGIAYKTKLRVANSPGTIDEDYTGELKVIIDNIEQKQYELHKDAWNQVHLKIKTSASVELIDGSRKFDRDEEGQEYPLGTYLIRKGDRIAQAVMMAAERMEFTQVDRFEKDTARGTQGFGHTGTR